MTVFPLRMVYRVVDGMNPCQMMISVPKRHFIRANKRNRVKRQVREAYRKNKGLIAGKELILAFIWIDDKLHSTEEVEKCVVRLLTRVAEKVTKEPEVIKEQEV